MTILMLALLFVAQARTPITPGGNADRDSPKATLSRKLYDQLRGASVPQQPRPDNHWVELRVDVTRMSQQLTDLALAGEARGVRISVLGDELNKADDRLLRLEMFVESYQKHQAFALEESRRRADMFMGWIKLIASCLIGLVCNEGWKRYSEKRKLAAVAVKIEDIRAGVKELSGGINGRMDELLKATGVSERAKGVIEGRAEEKAGEANNG